MTKFNNKISIRGNMNGDINNVKNVGATDSNVLTEVQAAQLRSALTQFLSEYKSHPDADQNEIAKIAPTIDTLISEDEPVTLSYARSAIKKLSDYLTGVSGNLLAAIITAQVPWIWT
ncbi:hypothetical protein [Nocardia cerradoensis]|uniref:hypothetical protein n=1 Tax=Nocardia cerradoensis TaxID=85688 RepID=UPI00117F7CCA|nr:hypothetical protein [Nocardia cerradoensis]